MIGTRTTAPQIRGSAQSASRLRIVTRIQKIFFCTERFYARMY